MSLLRLLPLKMSFFFPNAAKQELSPENTTIMGMSADEILGVATIAAQKNLKLKWYLKKGRAVTGRTVKVLDSNLVLMEERSLWDTKAKLIEVSSVYSVAFV